MIIDTHAHIFPDAIARKATDATSGFYGLHMDACGDLKGLIRAEREARVDKVLVCSAATTAKQTMGVNDFIASAVKANADFLYGLGAMNQDFPDKYAEVERIKSLGLKGIKIHPDIQGVAMDDKRLYEMYEALGDLNLPLLAHTGDVRYANSNPAQILRVLDNFPRLRLVGAHMGCWSDWDEGSKLLCGRGNFFVDCSSSFYSLSDETALAVIRRYGAERVMFGSDFPMWSPKDELSRLAGLGLTASELDKIRHKTAEVVYGLNN